MLNDPDARESQLTARLGALNITWTTHEHRPVFTVEEAADVSDHLPGGHTKNLFLKDKKGGLWLAVVRAALRVDLNALAKQIGAPRFSFGSPELLVQTLAITPGSVTPFALMYDTENKVRPILDAAMLEMAPLNFHPLRNDRTTAIAPADLLRFIESCGHAPLIVPIPEVAST